MIKNKKVASQNSAYKCWSINKLEQTLTVDIGKAINQFLEFIDNQELIETIAKELLNSSLMTTVIGSTVWNLIDNTSLSTQKDLDLRVDFEHFTKLKAVFTRLKSKFESEDIRVFTPSNNKSFTITLDFNTITKTIDISDARVQIPEHSFTHLGNSLTYNIGTRSFYTLMPLPDSYTIKNIRNKEFIPNPELSNKAECFARYTKALYSKPEIEIPTEEIRTRFNTQTLTDLLFPKEAYLDRFIEKHILEKDRTPFLFLYFQILITQIKTSTQTLERYYPKQFESYSQKKEIERKEEKLKTLTAELDKAKRTISHQEEIIKRSDASLNQLLFEKADLNKHIEELKAQTFVQNSKILEQESKIKELSQSVRDKESEINIIKIKSNEKSIKKQKLEELEKQKALLEKENEEYKTKLKRLLEQLEESNQKIQEIETLVTPLKHITSNFLDSIKTITIPLVLALVTPNNYCENNNIENVNTLILIKAIIMMISITYIMYLYHTSHKPIKAITDRLNSDSITKNQNDPRKA